MPVRYGGAPRLWLAVGAGVLVMATTRSALAAMIVGTAAAGLARSIGAKAGRTDLSLSHRWRWK